jgi:hypothetical protein
MISRSKFGVLASVAMMGTAAPAFAQKIGTTKNIYSRNSPHTSHMVSHAHLRSGLRAFGMVPGAAFGSNSPSATGGGSIGYNSHNEAHF